jgi:polar amino acid transport system substrate-binding protein
MQQSGGRVCRFGVAVAAAMLLLVTGGNAVAQLSPAPGVSPRIDGIRKAGMLRAGVVNNPPWLVQNTSGEGEPWSGPSWMLGKEFARLLGVRLEPVLVSHETKVPALMANQMDIMIGPLNQNAERAKIIDFVTFSSTSVCMIGRADNPRFAQARSLDDFNRPDVTIAYFTGAGEEPLVKERFPKARLRGVANSGSVAPIEEIMAGRSDVAPLNRMLWPGMSKKLKALAAFPKENDCQDSKIFDIPAGMGVAKNQQVYLDWLRAVEKRMEPALIAEEARISRAMK